MSQNIWGDKTTQFFFELTPEKVLDAIDKVGFKTTGRALTLNSMENRVYEIEIDIPEAQSLKKTCSPSDSFVIAKFYRPGRWTKEQIQEEHDFLIELASEELPVIAPIIRDGLSLFTCPNTGLFYCLFPKRGGRINAEITADQIGIVARTLARIHNIGAKTKAQYRLSLTPQVFANSNLNYLLDSKAIPQNYENQYREKVEEISSVVTPLFKNIKNIRIHGDCHWGNIIWRPPVSTKSDTNKEEQHEKAFFIDLDDMLNGPAVQDIWLIVPGTDSESMQKRDLFFEAYEQFRDFDYRELKLIEPLRTLRYIHFTAWIARRWEDPAFKNAFSHFGTENYWQTSINDLDHQLRLIQQAGENQFNF